MSIKLDFTGTNHQAHQQYDYPESDEALIDATRELLKECVDKRESDFNTMPFLKTTAFVQELRSRDVNVTSSVEGVWLCEEDKP